MRMHRKWPVALAALFLALLAWYLVYTEGVVSAVRANAETLTRIYAHVQEGVTDPRPESTVEALFRLQGLILESGVPLVMTGPGDTVLAVQNLPFEVDLSTSAGQARVQAYVRRLDARNPPVGDPSVTHLHFGDPPELRRLRWIPWLQAGGLLLTVAVGVAVIRAQRRAEAERVWTTMARELAHQLGTPISSLQGWLEVLKLPEGERPGGLGDPEVAGGIEDDLQRLERVSRRFELIGREPELEPLDIRDVARDLERYLEARLPRFGPGVELAVEVAGDLPPIRGSHVLLAWALENVVKNAMDALGGRGGRISVRARAVPPGWVTVEVEDSGPGVAPDVRDSLFEAGVTTKAGGWGVGLALARRIVEGVHGGRIELAADSGSGATFVLRLPAATSRGRAARSPVSETTA